VYAVGERSKGNLRWRRAILFAISVILIVNGCILCAASLEYVRYKIPDDWGAGASTIGPVDGEPVVLFHGFSGTPADVSPLAQALASKGFRVTIPLIPYQSSGFFAYSRPLWKAGTIMAFARNVVEREHEETKKVPIVVGFSMGGAIASALCVEISCKRVVLISPFFSLTGFGHLQHLAARGMQFLFPVVPKLTKGQINDPVGYASYKAGTYFLSVGSFIQLLALGKLGSRSGAQLAAPTLVVLSENDAVADPRETKAALCKNKKVKWLWAPPSANHILLYDYGRATLMEEIVSFIAYNGPET
jgi:esterase/lipase